MQYHVGLGIGHTYSHHQSSVGVNQPAGSHEMDEVPEVQSNNILQDNASIIELPPNEDAGESSESGSETSTSGTGNDDTGESDSTGGKSDPSSSESDDDEFFAREEMYGPTAP
jgi:hypothetical protein